MAIPYGAIFLLLVLQFFRPTLLGWFLTLTLFASYAAAVFVKASFREDYFAGVLVGIVPTIALLWARPRPTTQDPKSAVAASPMTPEENN
jgi:hypothetical protein